MDQDGTSVGDKQVVGRMFAAAAKAGMQET